MELPKPTPESSNLIAHIYYAVDPQDSRISSQQKASFEGLWQRVWGRMWYGGSERKYVLALVDCEIEKIKSALYSTSIMDRIFSVKPIPKKELELKLIALASVLSEQTIAESFQAEDKKAFNDLQNKLQKEIKKDFSNEEVLKQAERLPIGDERTDILDGVILQITWEANLHSAHLSSELADLQKKIDKKLHLIQLLKNKQNQISVLTSEIEILNKHKAAIEKEQRLVEHKTYNIIVPATHIEFSEQKVPSSSLSIEEIRQWKNELIQLQNNHRNNMLDRLLEQDECHVKTLEELKKAGVETEDEWIAKLEEPLEPSKMFEKLLEPPKAKLQEPLKPREEPLELPKEKLQEPLKPREEPSELPKSKLQEPLKPREEPSGLRKAKLEKPLESLKTNLGEPSEPRKILIKKEDLQQKREEIKLQALLRHLKSSEKFMGQDGKIKGQLKLQKMGESQNPVTKMGWVEFLDYRELVQKLADSPLTAEDVINLLDPAIDQPELTKRKQDALISAKNYFIDTLKNSSLEQASSGLIMKLKNIPGVGADKKIISNLIETIDSCLKPLTLNDSLIQYNKEDLINELRFLGAREGSEGYLDLIEDIKRGSGPYVRKESLSIPKDKQGVFNRLTAYISRAEFILANNNNPRALKVAKSFEVGELEFNSFNTDLKLAKKGSNEQVLELYQKYYIKMAQKPNLMFSDEELLTENLEGIVEPQFSEASDGIELTLIPGGDSTGLEPSNMDDSGTLEQVPEFTEEEVMEIKNKLISYLEYEIFKITQTIPASYVFKTGLENEREILASKLAASLGLQKYLALKWNIQVEGTKLEEEKDPKGIVSAFLRGSYGFPVEPWNTLMEAKLEYKKNLFLLQNLPKEIPSPIEEPLLVSEPESIQDEPNAQDKVVTGEFGSLVQDKDLGDTRPQFLDFSLANVKKTQHFADTSEEDAVFDEIIKMELEDPEAVQASLIQDLFPSLANKEVTFLARFLIPFTTQRKEMSMIALLKNTAFKVTTEQQETLPEDFIQQVNSWDIEEIEREYQSILGDAEHNEVEEEHFRQFEDPIELQTEIKNTSLSLVDPNSFKQFLNRLKNMKEYILECQEKGTQPTVKGAVIQLYLGGLKEKYEEAAQEFEALAIESLLEGQEKINLHKVEEAKQQYTRNIQFHVLLDLLLCSYDSHPGQYMMQEGKCINIDFARFFAPHDTLLAGIKGEVVDIFPTFRSFLLDHPAAEEKICPELIKLIQLWNVENLEVEWKNKGIVVDYIQFEGKNLSFVEAANLLRQSSDNLEKYNRLKKECYSHVMSSAFKDFKNRMLALQNYIEQKREDSTLKEAFNVMYPNLAPFFVVMERMQVRTADFFSLYPDNGDLKTRNLKEFFDVVRRLNPPIASDEEIEEMNNAFQRIENKSPNEILIGLTMDIDSLR